MERTHQMSPMYNKRFGAGDQNSTNGKIKAMYLKGFKEVAETSE